jgi:Transposase DDE domain
MIVVIMYITETTRPGPNGTLYRCVLLRQSYREGKTVKNRTLANLSHCTPQEMAALRLALRHKDDLAALDSVQTALEVYEGPAVGAVWTIYQVARRLGIPKARGTDFAGKLALWQVMARVIDQGARLSAGRLAQTHAACELLHFPRGFDENDLYENLAWLATHQATIEQRLFAVRHGQRKPALFLYDVTSSYLEGHCNALAAFGYNRDGKAGKRQVVVGLLCDDEGVPVSTDVFAGNTPDLATLAPQIRKVARRFGCERVTFVGDRGMIKSGQVAELAQVGFHYIPALTKAQIERLLKDEVFQLAWFGADVYEVEHAGLRYILRRNPQRAAEVDAGRQDKRQAVEQLVSTHNAYLRDHRRAQVAVALKKAQTRLARFKSEAWLHVEAQGRGLRLVVDAAARAETARLEGCYGLKTDLPSTVASAMVVHERYKELALVEQAFRTCKTAHLELRPWYVRTEASTRGHVLVVMLSYVIVRALRQAWSHLNVTVAEGICQLAKLSALEMSVDGQGTFCRVPKPRGMSQRLLEAAGVELPDVLPQRKVAVVTRTKLPGRRKH